MKYLFLLISIFNALISQAQTPNLEWVNTQGDGAQDQGRVITTDGAGNVYAAGFYAGSVDFDPGPANITLTDVGSVDVFICKYNSTGALVWAKSVGGEYRDMVDAIAVDGSGNVYVSGSFEVSADFDPGPNQSMLTSNGVTDVFILKLTSNGDFVYVKQIGSRSYEDHAYIAVNPNDELVVAGPFYGTLDVNPGGATTNLVSKGSQDIYLIKLDATGSFVFARQIGGTGNDEIASLALDASGNIYATGSFDSNTDFDPGENVFNINTTSAGQIYFSKLNSDGNFVWAKSIEGDDVVIPTSIKPDASGNVIIGANFTGTVDADPGAGIANLVADGSHDILFAKYDGNGNLLFAKRVGGIESDFVVEISIDRAGYIYMTGDFWKEVDFDPGSGTHILNAGGTPDIFVAKYSPVGDYIWAIAIGSPYRTSGGSGIAITGNGNICVTGAYAGTIDFDPGAGTVSRTSKGEFDIFVMQLTNLVSLPLQLLSFTAQENKNNVLLNWQTSLEINTLQFDIERSVDGNHFVSISVVKSQNSTGTHIYSVTDANAFNLHNILFYRLKMIDRDGGYKYSPVVNVSVEKKTAITMQPNPANNYLQITGINGVTAIKLLSANGQLLMQKVTSGSSCTLDISQLKAGSYFIQCTTGNDTITQQIIKQ